jgi:regulatory protein
MRSGTAPRTDTPPPTEDALHEAALRHLARYATTRAGLLRVLERHIDRWVRGAAVPDDAFPHAEAARAAARQVVARLAEAGAVDDIAFAASRARSLTRAGHSRRAVAAHLVARGVGGDEVREALPDNPEAELAAAIALARRRHIGPFRTHEVDAEARRRELAILARAGFTQDVASRALRTDPAAAEALLIRLRQE